MENTSNNEVVLIGKMILGIHHIQSHNQKACKVRIKVTENDSTNVIPVIFINPDENKLIQCKNKDLSIIGHIETKWNTRIIVDAYKTEDDDSVQFIITNNNSH